MEKNIEIVENNGKQEIVLTIDGISKTIYELDSYSDEHYCNFIEDGKYIIVFETRVVDSDDPYYKTSFRHAKAVYDLENNELLDLNEETKNRLYGMYLAKRCYSLKVVLTLLTGNNLTIDKDAVNEFYQYLTGNNDDITIDEVRNYILTCYPLLASFKDIKSYRLNKKKIEEAFNQKYLTFHSMKQDLREYNKFISGKLKELVKK